MVRSRILHRTYYNFSGPVLLGPHVLRLRPREGHDLRIVASTLDLHPAGTVRWYRDAEDNCVGVATMPGATQHLEITSDVIVEQYPAAPVLAAGFAADPNGAGDAWHGLATLSPYRETSGPHSAVEEILPWSDRAASATRQPHTTQILTELSERIRTRLRYAARVEAGVQTPHYTLATGAGSCRDMAALFIEAARHLGFAARYVAGYLRTDASSAGFGATHAWAEAYLPERGWTAFDPTGEAAVGPDHIAVNVARDPGTVPPVSGSFTGIARASLEIGVWVTRLADDAAA